MFCDNGSFDISCIPCSTAKKRRGNTCPRLFLPLLGSSTSGVWCLFYILWYNLYTTSFACKFHAIFPPPSHDPPKPQSLCPFVAIPQKHKKKRKKDIAKSLISGWSFSQRNIKTLQKKKNGKKRHSLCVMKRNERTKKIKSRWQGTSQTNPFGT